MDLVVSAALEEICSQGASGLSLSSLWTKLSPTLSANSLPLCPAIKSALCTNLLNVPGLIFQANGVFYNPDDLPEIGCVEECERLGMRVVASDNLLLSFVGIYDIKASDSGISQIQRRVLQRLATARTNGVTQSELAKEFGIKGNNIFYILRILECRGLIVRQSTVLRTVDASCEKESKTSSTVTTNMLHLHRYAKHLSSQQRLEVTKKASVMDENADSNFVDGDGIDAEFGKEDVHVKDYLPALKAICDKLELADGKALVVADIKRDLGYKYTPGHRAWRNILNRLKDAHVVEDFCAKVNKKEVSCLRLLKSFSPKIFEHRATQQDDDDDDSADHLGKRSQITDQLLELPIEHQIYDMIDAEGSKGLTIIEVCKRFGLNTKQFHTRFRNMFSRFGMQRRPENHNRVVGYRVWTPGNFNHEASFAISNKPEKVSISNCKSTSHTRDADFNEMSAQKIPGLDVWTSEVDVGDSHKLQKNAIELELSCGAPTDRFCVEISTNVSNIASLESSSVALSTPRKRKADRQYPCLTLTAASARREQWILQMLHDKKFIIRCELHRELINFEKDKETRTDRKTLKRALDKLQQKGHCKCFPVGAPVVTNCGRSRPRDVILQASINVTPEIFAQIHERLRSFDMEIRNQGPSKLKKDESVPTLDGVQRILKNAKLDGQAEYSEAMRANGFVSAKMVRTKLLHFYLWSYLSSSPGWCDALSSGELGYDLKNPHSTCKLFSLVVAIKAMPFELFFQVVGSTNKFEDMIEKCRIGLRLSDLPDEEYKRIMDTRATGRLSCIVDVLRRLKSELTDLENTIETHANPFLSTTMNPDRIMEAALSIQKLWCLILLVPALHHLLIQLVRDGQSEENATDVAHVTFTYAMEVKPYIEEPVSVIVPSGDVASFDLRPQIRHDFVLSSKEAVDAYWNTLEYSYVAADSRAALLAFPGSAVNEVIHFRSWTSVRVMTADQRAELLKRVENDVPNKKMSFKECEKVAKDLNLTLEQVLRVYYDKRRQLPRFEEVLDAQGEDLQSHKKQVPSSRKRKKSSGRSLSTTEDDPSNRKKPARSSDAYYQSTEGQNLPSTSLSEHGDLLETSEFEIHGEATKEPDSSKEREHHSLIHDCALSRMKSKHNKRFSWTEKAERKLVVEYARERASLGAKFHRIHWSSLLDLPAPPDVCKRRMVRLNSHWTFRKAMMRLCNVLGEQYAKHLDQLQSKQANIGNCNTKVRNSVFGKGCSSNLSAGIEDKADLCLEKRWYNFETENVKSALEDVLRFRTKKRIDSAGEQSTLNINAEDIDPLETSMATDNRACTNNVHTGSSSSRRISRKYTKLLNGGISVSRRTHDSVAVSTAVELFKLIFLSTSSTPDAPNLLDRTLRRYSEHDLFAAFNYLRENKIMIGGTMGRPFVLSQQFLHNISSSPFPINTGKRAAKFARWICEKEKYLIEEGKFIATDLQCGDMFHICALVFTGEFSVSPCLLDEGSGEPEDSRISKRKGDHNNVLSRKKAKKRKRSSAGKGEISYRREKGFPGIRLLVSRVRLSKIDAVEILQDGHINIDIGEADQGYTYPSTNTIGTSFSSNHVEELLNRQSSSVKGIAGTELEWEGMTSYATRLMSSPANQQVNPFRLELFKNLYSVIQKAGDQGLTMEEVTQIMNSQENDVPELVVEALEAFGRVVKVNSYASVHVVDSLYRSKYFLTKATFSQHVGVALTKDSKTGNDNDQPEQHKFINRQPEQHKFINRQSEQDEDVNTGISKGAQPDNDGMHNITILNLPKVVSMPSNDVQHIKSVEGRGQVKDTSTDGNLKVKNSEFHPGDFELCRPILPWVNDDGTVNKIVYKGLLRRVLGIVMQNPGMLEDNIINRMSVLNPQSCRQLLKLMIMDNHIIVRKMNQRTSGESPSILSSLFKSNFKKSKLVCREHFFANPMSTTSL